MKVDSRIPKILKDVVTEEFPVLVRPDIIAADGTIIQMGSRKLKILILDDDLGRIESFVKNLESDERMVSFSTTASGVMELLQKESWDVLFLDHDLGGQVYVDSNEENTGATVARWLKDHPEYQPSQIFTHSLNEAGRKVIVSHLPEAKEAPFAWMAKFETKG